MEYQRNSTPAKTRYAADVAMISVVLAMLSATAQGAPEPGARIGEELFVAGHLEAEDPDVYHEHTAVAMHPDDGVAVVVWSSAPTGPFLDNGDILVRRYAADGQAIGDVTVANTTTAAGQTNPSVAMASDGSFVVVWQGVGADDESGIYMRRYDPNGAPAGFEIRVNTTKDGAQFDPAIAMAADGRFVVVWDSGEIFFQRYSSDGMPIGSEGTITEAIGDKGGIGAAAAAMAGDGRFVVTWMEYDSPSNVIGLQRYDGNGMPLGGPVPVNTTPVGSSAVTSAAMAANGRFVVVWSRESEDRTFDVFLQRYGSDGAPEGPETPVNTTTVLSQGFGGAAVAMASDGSVAVAWHGFGATDDFGVFLQRYAPDGTPLDGELLVNTGTDGAQRRPGIAVDADGDVTFSWASANCKIDPTFDKCIVDPGLFVFDDLETGVYLQRFAGYEPLDLSVVLNASSDSVTAGGRLSYSIIVTNEHAVTENPAVGVATGLNVVLDVPDEASVTGVSGDGWRCADERPTLCNYERTLAPLDFSTLMLDVNAPATAGTLEATVTLDGNQFDPDLDSNAARAETTVTAPEGGGGNGDGDQTDNGSATDGGGAFDLLWLMLLAFLLTFHRRCKRLQVNYWPLRRRCPEQRARPIEEERLPC